MRTPHLGPMATQEFGDGQDHRAAAEPRTGGDLHYRHRCASVLEIVGQSPHGARQAVEGIGAGQCVGWPHGADQGVFTEYRQERVLRLVRGERGGGHQRAPTRTEGIT
ncbi:hypothetical protein GCM10027590_57920 [Nocardiopsis nanhaiensis]